jgi:integrase/recombinase XerD
MMDNTGSTNTKNGTDLLILDDLLEQYWLSLKAANRSPKTISRYEGSLRTLAGFLNSKGLCASVNLIGVNEIISFIRYLQESHRWPNRKATGKDYGGLSPFTIQGYVRDLKAFWNWLGRQGYITNNVMVKLPLPGVPQVEMPTFSPEQVRSFLSAIDKTRPPGARCYSLLVLILDTGLRIGEAVNIKMVDLDIKGGLITVIGKGQKQRAVPFSPFTRRVLIRYVGEFRHKLIDMESAYLFPAPSGDHISINSVQQYMRRLAKRIGLSCSRCSPHVLRHTFATRAVANGANLFALKSIMGHSSLQTTAKYTHLSPSDLRTQHSTFSPVESMLEGK